MPPLSIVKTLSYLQEEQKAGRQYLEVAGLRLLRGSIAEFTGPQSSGKTSLALAILAHMTMDGEICSIIDLNNSFDPESARLSGAVFSNVLWIRCGGNIENAFTAADFLLQANGFGLVWLNFFGVQNGELRKVPRSYWYRFRVKIRDTKTILIVTNEQSVAGSAAESRFYADPYRVSWKGAGRFKLIKELQLNLNGQKECVFRPEFVGIKADYINE
ncbi:MAG: hypothetical protein C4324_05880 [Blastocatellia bacterium]